MAVFVVLSGVVLYPILSAVPIPQGVESLPELTGTITDPMWSSHAAGIFGLWVALWWAYFIFGWGLLSATPGKWLLGLRIVDHRGMLPIGASRAALRLVAYMVSSALFGAGHLFILFRSDRRALHDILAGTRVVCVSLAPQRTPVGQERRPWPTRLRREPRPEPEPEPADTEPPEVLADEAQPTRQD